MARKWISETHTLKILLEPQGAVFALTGKRLSVLLLVTRRFVGVRRIRTADRVVAKAGYSAVRTVSLIRELYPDGVERALAGWDK
jgi:hypothetical protein